MGICGGEVRSSRGVSLVCSRQMYSTHSVPLGWAIGHQFPIQITGLCCLEQIDCLPGFLKFYAYLLRKGHYIVAEYVDKVTNRYRPNYPWQV